MADVAIYDRSDYRFIPSFMMRCFAVSILKAQSWTIRILVYLNLVIPQNRVSSTLKRVNLINRQYFIKS